MSKYKRIIDETGGDAPKLPPPVVAPRSPDVTVEAKPWWRVRLVTENGVRGHVLERLEFHDGQPRVVRVHDVDRRDVTLGHVLREIELDA